MSGTNTTIGELSGLVPMAELKEVQSELERLAKTNERLKQDIETRDQTIFTLETKNFELIKKTNQAKKDKSYAESEAVKTKGDEARYKREIERLNKANDELSQEVDQLRSKGSEMWGTLKEVKRVRDEYVSRLDYLQKMYDEVHIELAMWRKAFRPVVNSYSNMISEFTEGIGKLLSQPGVQIEIKRILDEAAQTEDKPDAM